MCRPSEWHPIRQQQGARSGRPDRGDRTHRLAAAEQAREVPDAIGQAIPGGTLCLRDEAGRELTSPEAEGELVYRGANVMMGYAEIAEDLLRGPELSELATGDLARRGPEMHLMLPYLYWFVEAYMQMNLLLLAVFMSRGAREWLRRSPVAGRRWQSAWGCWAWASSCGLPCRRRPSWAATGMAAGSNIWVFWEWWPFCSMCRRCPPRASWCGA